MATDYYLDLETEAGPDEIAARLRAVVSGTIDSTGKFLRVTAGALSCHIVPETDPIVRKWFLEDWQIDSKISLSFSLDRSASDDDYVAGRRAFSIASVRLGEDLDTNAILRFEVDRLMMRRQNGALNLYDWWPDWTHPDVITTLPPGYTLLNDGQDTPKPATGH